MAPPGRRRNGLRSSLLYIFSTIALSLLIASFPSTVSAAGTGVIGIDLGAEYIKAAVVKPGVPLDIVLTKDSKRKELSAVAFKPARESGAAFPERFYGSDALALAPRFPDDVYSNLKSLLGVPFETGIQGSEGGEQNVVELYRQRFPGVKVEPASDGRGTVGIRSGRIGEKEGKEPFLVEELLAMQLKQIKANAEETGGQKSYIEDAVISVPPFFSAEEKRSVQFAAELAGLNVLTLLTDGMSVALNYATSRSFPNVTNSEKPEHHIVFDMGAGSTSATVLKFQSRTVKDFGKYSRNIQEIQAVGVGWDKTLGGDALNQLIVDDMVSQLVGSKKLKAGTTSQQVKAHGKTMAKLWKESERLRQILSANTQTMGSFESLYEDDVNFKYTISRSTFEKLADSHAQRISKPLTNALAMAKLKFDDIDSIILHGGAVRTPFVQKQIEETCGDTTKLRTNVNADEAAAFGAAFKAAALSRAYRVREIKTLDIPGYAASITYVTGGKERRQKAFLETSQIGQEKLTIIRNVEDFEFGFNQQFIRNNQTIEYPVFQAKTTNLTLAIDELKQKFGCGIENVTIWFGMHLNPVNAIPEITRGSASCEVEIETKKSVVDKAKEFIGLGSKKGQQPIEDDSSSEQSSTSTSSNESASTSAQTSSTSSASEDASPSAEPKQVEVEDVEQPRNFRVESSIIGFEASAMGIPRPSKEERRRIRDRLKAFDASDLARVHREETLNTLESFIYRCRDLLDDTEFGKAIAKDSLEKLKKNLPEVDTWLQEKGSDAPTNDLKAKLDSLRELVDPALKRQSENSERPAKIEGLKRSLDSAKMFVDIIEKQVKAEESAFSASSSASTSESSSSQPSAEIPSPDTPGSSDTSSESGSKTDSSSSSTTSTSSSKPSATYSTYTPTDLSLITNTYKSINTWLEEKLKLQDKLTESDDPAITVAEMEVKLGELQNALTKVMEKMTRKPKAGNGGGKKQEKKNDGKKADKSKEKPKAKSKADKKKGKEDKADSEKKETVKDEL